MFSMAWTVLSCFIMSCFLMGTKCLHLLKISVPLHTTTLANKVLRTDMVMLVGVTGSVFITSYLWSSRPGLLEWDHPLHLCGVMVKYLCLKSGWIYLPVLAWLCELIFTEIRSKWKEQKIKFILGRESQTEKLYIRHFSSRKDSTRGTLSHLSISNMLLVLSFPNLKGLLDH